MKIPFRVNQREKRVLLMGGAMVAVIIVYQLYGWYGGLIKKGGEFVGERRTFLERQYRKISEKTSVQKEHSALEADLKALEAGLLPGDTPPIAAARMQNMLKEMAQSAGIEITLEKTINPVEKGMYLVIPVEIGFTATTEKLSKMLYQITASKTILAVSDMKVTVKNIRNPIDAYTTLVINGLIVKTEPEKQEPVKDTDAT